MRRFLCSLLFLACFAAFAPSSRAGIAQVGGCAAAATSCTLSPAASTGQYIYIFAFRSAVTAPTLPGGWTQIATASASSSSFRSGCQVATGSTTATGTWTNATLIVAEIYSGQNATATANCATAGTAIGLNTNSSSTTSTISYTGGALTVQSGSSWIIGASGSSATTCTPAGITNRQNASSSAALLGDSNAGVASFSTVTCTGTTGNSKTNVLELLALEPTFSTSCQNNGPVGTTLTCTVNIAVGQAAIACENIGGNVTTPTTLSSVADNGTSGGNTYTAGPTVLQSAGAQVRTTCFTVLSATVTATIVTFTTAGVPADAFCSVLVYNNVTALGHTATNTGTASGATVALATQDANNFCSASIGLDSAQTLTQTVGLQRQSNTSTFVAGDGSDNELVSAGTCTNTATYPGTHNWAAVAIELRTSSSGSTPPTQIGGFLVGP